MDCEHTAPFIVWQPDEPVEPGGDLAPLGRLVELPLGAWIDALRLFDGGDAGVVHPDVDRAELRLELFEGSIDRADELERGGGERGLVTMCCGGGLGSATLIERL